jgi:AAA domain
VNSKAPIWVKRLVDAISNGLITEVKAREALRRVERTHPDLIGVDVLFDIEMSNVMFSEVDINIPPQHMATKMGWQELYAQEMREDWLVRGVWPVGRQIHLHAERKMGKSLVALWMAANIANGIDPFSGERFEPVNIAYLDYEMTPADLRERLEDMGFTPATLKNLHYFLHPTLPKLDTELGGQRLMELLAWYECKAVVIDTVSRVIEGDENSNDTYIKMFNFTGSYLKAAQISLLRLDHEGHLNGRSRGASAKADDVDLVWQLKASDEGYALNCMHSRINSTSGTIAIKRQLEPTLSFSRAAEMWPAGVKDKANELDMCNVPIDATKTTASKILKENGYVGGRSEVLNAALRFRKSRPIGPTE